TRFFSFLFPAGSQKWRWLVLIFGVWFLPVPRLPVNLRVSFTNGLVSFSFEVLALFLFQKTFGFLYLAMSFLVGLFMAGLGVGGFFSGRKPKRREDLFWAETGQILFYVLATGVLLLPRSVPIVFFGILLAGSGFLLGWEFGLLATYGMDRNPGGIGLVYGADLVGALAASVLTPLFLLPVLSFSGCLGLFPCLKIATFLLLWHQLS
ncbi:MAG: hypothetical protein NC911_01485, partial [Candidatus Omnitrophica bacterium]|nr:hypothetical protein [Candidatus Omnitrophota bacterium]